LLPTADSKVEPLKPDPPKRRRFQFRLRTLMIVVTLLAVPLGYVGWQAKIVRERRSMLGTIDAAGGRYLAINVGDLPAGMTGPGWIRRFLGDVAVVEIDFHASSLSQDDLKEKFPEADCHVVPEGERVLPVGPY
jgi:hypothetical protein